MLIIPATIGGKRQLKDRSWRIAVETQELSGEELMELNDLSEYCFVSFKSEQFSDEETKMLSKMEADPFKGFGSKSPSQKLRSVLFVNWKENDEGDSFETFYNRKMNEIIRHFKEKITDKNSYDRLEQTVD